MNEPSSAIYSLHFDELWFSVTLGNVSSFCGGICSVYERTSLLVADSWGNCGGVNVLHLEGDHVALLCSR